MTESSSTFPTTGRLAAVDYGTVRIGIAVCDPMRILVSPLEIRAVTSREADGEYFAKLAKREAIDGFVIGLPVHLDGGESQKSIEVRRFGRWLHDVTGVPVRLFDERFTSSTAEDLMRSRNQVDPRSRSKKAKMRPRNIDAVAAQVILESFLEAARYRTEGIPGQALGSVEKGDVAIDDRKQR